jgi:hypothetical protein
MPRPEIIDRLFEARYEYEMALFTDKAPARIRWRTIFLEIIQQYNCTEEALQQVLRGHYREWIRQNNCPTRRKSEEDGNRTGARILHSGYG